MGERCMIEGQVKTAKVYGSSSAMALAIIRTEGFFGLYRAFWIHQMTWVPFNGMYWGVYDWCKAKQDNPNSAIAFTSRATLAGVSASIATSPIDLVKTRMQVAKA